jgi:phage head maturation protease
MPAPALPANQHGATCETCEGSGEGTACANCGGKGWIPHETPPEAAQESRSRPSVGQVEQRAADALTAEGARLRGRIPYGVESRDLGGWREVISAGALRSTNLDSLVARVDHAGVPIGRFPGTLDLEDRVDGMGWSVSLPESRSDVREAVARGDLNAGSWQMVVGSDRWVGDVRHVDAISELRDVSIVSNPAYGSAAAVEYRSIPTTAPPSASQEAVMADAPAVETPPVEPVEAPPVEDRSASPRISGGLRPEDRSGPAPQAPIEERIISSMRGIAPGENRALTDPSLSLLAPPELSTHLWDLLRPVSVVLETGITTITTDRQQVEWPRVTADPTAAFYNEADEITPSDPSFDTLTAVPKAIKALVRGSSEAFSDSSPDLLTLLQRQLNLVMGLKVDAAFLFGAIGTEPKGFASSFDVSAGSTLDWDLRDNWDPILRAVGYLQGAHVEGPYAVIMHPWAATHLALVKRFSGSGATSNESLVVPDGVPPRSVTSLIPVDGSAHTSSAYVFAPQSVGCVRRQDSIIEVDRSQEFSSDQIQVRSRARLCPVFPYPQAIVKVINVPSPNPTLG